MSLAASNNIEREIRTHQHLKSNEITIIRSTILYFELYWNEMTLTHLNNFAIMLAQIFTGYCIISTLFAD